MLVESHDKHSEVGEFDPDTGRLTRLERNKAAALLDQKLCGHFADLGEVLGILYLHEGHLMLRLDRTKTPATAETVRWEADGPRAILSIVDASIVVASARYRRGPATGPKLSVDPTPFIEPEDWDFGLFVRNVVGDTERARRIYR